MSLTGPVILAVLLLPAWRAAEPYELCSVLEHLMTLPNGSMIVVRATLEGSDEATYLTSRCQSNFKTGDMVWPNALRLAHPLEDRLLFGRLNGYGPAYSPIAEALDKYPPIGATITIVVEGRLERRERYFFRRIRSGMMVGNGFGHLNGFPAQLVVTRVWKVEASR